MDIQDEDPYFKRGSIVEVSSEEDGFKDSFFIAKVVEPPVEERAVVEYEDLLQDDGVTPLSEKVDCRCLRPPPPSDSQMEDILELYDVVDASDNGGWWTGVVARIEEPDHTYSVAFKEPEPHMVSYSRQSLRPHRDWNPVTGTWSRPSKLKELPSSLDILNQQQEKTNSGNLWHPSKEQQAKQYITSETPLAVLFPSHTQFGHNKCQEPPLPQPDTPITPLLETGELGSHTRCCSATKKRSRSNNPKKRPSESSIESANDSTAGPADEYRDTFHDTVEIIDLTMSPERDANASTVGNLYEHSLSEELHTPQVVENPIRLSSKKLHSPEVVDEPRNFPIMNGDPSNDVRDMEVEPGVNSPMTSNILSIQKNSPLWEVLESSEIFKKFPQNPHFLPLRGCKEVDREGLAIGRMVTFASTVEMTLKLKIADPIGSFDIHMESLLDLKTYGFDIEPFQSHLQKKLAIKVEHGKLQKRSKKAEGQMQELICKERKIDEEIRELQSKVIHLRGKIAQNEFEIINIGTCKDVINEMIKETEHHFENTDDIL